MYYSLAKSLFKIAITLFVASSWMVSHAKTQQIQSISIDKRLAKLEADSGGRIGVAAINTSNNMRIQYHATERFPTCSTAKIMTVAAILQESMRDKHYLQQKITYNKEDLVFYSPITEKHIADGMTIYELSAAAMTHSDGTAMKLLTRKLEGPKTVNMFAHRIGNDTFKLADDLSGTGTPVAMANSLRRLVFGNDLALPQREQLQAWLKQNTTGNLRIRAGVPKGWLVGDKTGTGQDGATHDIGIIWPPTCSPIIVAIYFTQNKKNARPKPNVIASVTRMLINEFAQTDQCFRGV